MHAIPKAFAICFILSKSGVRVLYSKENVGNSISEEENVRGSLEEENVGDSSVIPYTLAKPC